MRNESIEFEVLIKEIFDATSCDVVNELSSNIDLILNWNGDEFIAEIKYYRTKRAQVSLINRAISQFKIIKDARQDIIDDGVGGMLIISSYLEPGLKETIEKEEEILIVDLYDLIALTIELPLLREKLIKLLEIPNELINASRGRSLEELFEREAEFHDVICCSIPDYLIESDDESENFALRLSEIPAGRDNWKDYEVLMLEILKFLFEDDLKGWYAQYGSDNKLNRYDCVCGVKKTTDFWTFIVEQLKSNYLLFEFKNYSDNIGQGEVLTTEKYLFDNAFRKVAIIICRKGASPSAMEMCMGAMRESGRLMLVLNDEDIVKMIFDKNTGSDPSDYLHQKVDDFLMKLSR